MHYTNLGPGDTATHSAYARACDPQNAPDIDDEPCIYCQREFSVDDLNDGYCGECAEFLAEE
jgi:hypothetical protein